MNEDKRIVEEYTKRIDVMLGQIESIKYLAEIYEIIVFYYNKENK